MAVVGEPVAAVKVSALETFARQLRAWRKSKGWSQISLAGKLGYSDSLVSGIETQDKVPTLDFATKCDEAFELPGTFVALHALLSREAWPSYFSPVMDAESTAVRVHEWESRDVPGLLQSEAYARSVISAGQPRLTSAELDRKVTGRMGRQKIFERDDPPLYWCVIAEGALRQVIGSRAVMAEQLDKIIGVSSTPDVVVQVLPFTVSDHPGTDGPIMILDFEESSSIAYTECKGGGMLYEAGADVADLVTTLNMIRAASLPPRDSIDMLREIRSKLDD